jgi:hypothetical protein
MSVLLFNAPAFSVVARGGTAGVLLGLPLDVPIAAPFCYGLGQGDEWVWRINGLGVFFFELTWGTWQWNWDSKQI